MSQIDLEQARNNMIEQQIRPWDVLDQQVLDTLRAVPREDFVPDAWRNLAFADMSIPLDHGQCMMPPRVEARLLQALEIKPFETVLEVGTGSGYLTAALANLAKHVYSVELQAEFVEAAQQRLLAQGISNASVEQGDAAEGWPSHGPYDVIILTGSAAAVPDGIKQNLRTGGRLFAVVGDAPVMEARLMSLGEDGRWSNEALFETDLPRLEHFEVAEQFLF